MTPHPRFGGGSREEDLALKGLLGISDPEPAWFKNCGVEVTGSVGQVCKLK
jgi:hypothetical protein